MAESQDKEKLKILYFFSSVSIVADLLFIFIYWKLHSFSSGWVLAFALPLLFLTYPIYRVSASVILTGNWVITIGFLIFLGIAFFTGGPVSPALVWCLGIPIIATSICGPKSGAFWLAMVLIELSFFYIAGLKGHSFTQQLNTPRAFHSALYFNVIGVPVFTYIFSAMSETVKSRYLEEIRDRNFKLGEALEKIKTLRGLFPICAWCKRIRNDKGYWDQVETYLAMHTAAEFSHGICPECQKEQLKNWEKS